VADLLREMASLLEAQGEGNAFRIAAYRHAADTVAARPVSVREVFEREGLPGLDALPTIGPGIAAAIGEIVQTGRWARLDRLRGAAGAEAVFRSIPGVGPQLALRLHDDLGVDTLEALEIAAHDGRLAAVRGFGPRRAEAVRAALAGMLAKLRPHRPAVAGEEPPVALLLDLDREYRERADRGELRRIAPRRFNPAGEAWLPVLHETRGPWHLTALFSNTATAHRLGRVHDWVVIYFQHGDGPEGRRTVVTETTGAQRGKRVVRGRESEGAR